MKAKEALRVGEHFVAHVAATIVGAILALVGIGMGVTVFMLPIGIPLGLVGACTFIWGIWGFREARERRNGQAG